jgi:hypothetical protein
MILLNLLKISSILKLFFHDYMKYVSFLEYIQEREKSKSSILSNGIIFSCLNFFLELFIKGVDGILKKS